MRRMLLAAALLLVAQPVVAQSVDAVNAAIAANFGDYEAFETAFASIQGAIAEGDAEAVATWVAYPLLVTTADGKKLTLENEEEFVAHYDEFMTDEIVNVVATQDYADAFANYQGLMFGRGEVWISGVCPDEACETFDVRIITIQSTSN